MIEVEPGDLLLAINKTTNLVQVSQFLLATQNPYTRLTNQVESSRVSHAMISCVDDKNVTKIAHCASEKGVSIQMPGDAQNGYMVYRVANNRDVGNAVSEVAIKWTTGSTGAYSNVLAAQPAFHLSSYGSGAKARAAFFEKHKRTAGGPPSGKGKQPMFCSMFAIAVYQAALGAVRSAELMALDAPYTSPMKLHSYVNGHRAWTYVGMVN